MSERERKKGRRVERNKSRVRHLFATSVKHLLHKPLITVSGSYHEHSMRNDFLSLSSSSLSVSLLEFSVDFTHCLDWFFLSFSCLVCL